MASTFMPDLIFLLEHTPALGLVYGTSLFKGPKAKIPDGSGPYVSLIRAVGQGSEGTHNSVLGPAYEQPGAQVLVRATDYDVAEAKCQAIYDVMWPIQNVFINGTWWRSLTCKGELYDLPPDEKQRPRVAFNIGCVKRTSPATS